MSETRTVRLGDIAKIERKSVQPADLEGSTTYLGLEHIEKGGRIIGQSSVGESQLKSSKFQFTSEHILYGKLRPYLAKIAAPEFSGVCSTDILPIKPGSEVDKYFLFYYLRKPEMVALANKETTGANLPRISPKALENLRINLPDLQTQKKLAEQYRVQDLIQQKRERQQELFEELSVSHYERYFGQRENFDWVKLGDITSKIGSGATPKGGSQAYKSEGIALIRSMNVHDRRFVRDGLAFIDDDQAAALSNVEVQENDILLNITGASVARVCRVPANVLPARVNQHVAIIRLNPGTIEPELLERYLTLPSAKKQLLKIATSGGATREAITKSQIARFTVPLESKFENR